MVKSSSTTTTSSSSSSSSCFKIIACGGHDADVDDDVILSPQAKASSNKRGWSFRKRSGRHRAVGNNVSSETAAVNNKEIPQVIHAEYQVPVNSKSSEEKSQMSKPAEKTAKVVFASELVSDTKPPMTVASDNDGGDKKPQAQEPQADMVAETIINCSDTKEETQVPETEVIAGNVADAATAEEKIAMPAVMSENGDSVVVPEADSDADPAEPNTTESVIALEIGDDDGADADDSVAIIIQTAIRGFLAQRAITQLKSAVKLQAAIRGHLVRRNAVETLHCIRAIVKVQSLVRARSSKSLDHGYKPNNAQFSTVKLLQNSFARQLLESTPKTKPVNIRCDPLSPNSAWGWLERWMAVSATKADLDSTPVVESQDDNQHQETSVPANANVDHINLSDSVASKSNVTDVGPSHDTEENHIMDDISVEDSMLCHSSSAEVEMVQTPDTFEDDASSKMDARDYESSHVQEEVVTIIDEPTLESMKRPASEELDGDGKRFAFGSRKASNPAFIAAQTKFEELSTATKFGRSLSSPHQDLSPVSDLETISSADEFLKKTNEPAVVETSRVDLHSHVDGISDAEETVKKTNKLVVNETAPVDLHTHVAGSECGTELSISSTLDSPVRSDAGNADVEQNKFDQISNEPDPVEEAHGVDISSDLVEEAHGIDISSDPVEEAHGVDISSDPVVAEINAQEEQKLEMNAAPELQTNIERVSSVMTTESSQHEQKHELNDLDTHHGDKLSPEASPKSQRMVQDSYGTPSSQVSVKSKKSKTDKSGSYAKRSSLSGGKRTPSKSDVNSVTRSSSENLAKDHKNGKRRNSFGSSRSDNADQEPRESSARSSLPSYMQATESARAKAHSPRSSPDVHDKEVSSKKRHSLPGASGRQESPRIQRSASQAAQGAKANGSNERKWQR